MRKPICLHCGERLTHFGRGYKHRVEKFRGGWIHFDCKMKYIGTKRWHSSYQITSKVKAQREDDGRLLASRILVGRSNNVV